MDLLKRYLYQVERYLPLKERKDTIEELKSLILDELDSTRDLFDEEEQALEQVLLNLGEPKIVARKYINDAPLISKEMEPTLFLVLKITVAATIFGILLATLIGVFSEESFSILDLILSIIFAVPEAISAALAGVGMVFIVFLLLERYVRPMPIEEVLEFDPKKLPKQPEKIYKISLAEEIITIFGSIILLYILNYQSGIIAIYFDGNSVPLLNDNFNSILPLFNANIIFGFLLAVYHVIRREKNFVSYLFLLVHQVIGGIVALLLAHSDIFNDVIIEGYNLTIIPTMFRIGMTIAGVIAFIAAIVKFVQLLIERSGKKEYLKEIIEELEKK